MRTLLAVLAAVLLMGSASAMTLNDLVPGTTVAGPNLTVKDMKNKVVLVMFWGTH